MPQDPYRLSLAVTAADGHVQRWGGDELNSKDIPTGLSFSTSIPGGFKDMTCSLLRRIDVAYPDEALFDDVKVLGPGNETVWEGRMVQFPRQHGDQFSVQPGAVGWSSHLLDDPSFRMIYVDRDLSRWRGPSVQRQLNAITGGSDVEGPTVVGDATTGAPSLQTTFSGAWGRSHLSEAFYDSGGIDLDSIYYAWKLNANTGSADTNWSWNVLLSTDDVTSAVDATANLRAAGPGTGTLTATSSRKFGMLQQAYAIAAGTSGAEYGVLWTCLAVYGSTGLVKQGTADATNGQGFYASDIIAHIVSQAAPLLNWARGPTSINETSFVIPHMVIADPVTPGDAITLVNGYHLYEWGVYDDRLFFWRPPDPERCTWEARLSDGAQVSLEGDDANNIFNGVLVTYTDPSGRRSTVGPPGSNAAAGSVADLTDASLGDTSPANPVNAHGIPRRWGRLDVTNTTTQAGAIQLGATWLAEHNLPARRGQLTLVGKVQHPTQGQRPVWAVRAGDYIRIADRPNDPVRRIIETSYSHDTRQLTCSLDQTVFKLEAIMERMGVNLIGVI